MTRMAHGKLVRDRIPEIIRGSGRACATATLSDAEYRQALLVKLVEEAREAAAAPLETLASELADLYEVIDAVLAVTGVSDEAVRAKQTHRRMERGGFERRTALLWTDEAPI